MSLPDNLLNRVNKELKAKVEQKEDLIKTNLAAIQLEKQVLASYQAQVKDAKERLATAKRLEESAKVRLSKEEEDAARVKADAAKAKQILNSLVSRRADSFDKAKETETRLLNLRRTLEKRQLETKEVDAQMARWFEENRLTANATDAASNVFQDQSDQVAKMRRQSEVLVSQINDLQHQIRMEEESLSKTEDDKKDCDDAVRQYKKEILKTKQDLDEISRREESNVERQADIKSRKDTLLKEIRCKELERNEIAGEARSRGLEIESAERTRERTINLWNRMQRDLSEISEKLHHDELLERGEYQKLMIAVQEQNRLKRDQATLLEKKGSVEEALVAAEQQLQQLEMQTGLHRSDTGQKQEDALRDELDAIKAVQVEQEENLRRVDQLIDRGREAIQRIITEQVEAACATENESKEVVWRRQQLQRVQAKEKELSKSLQLQDAAIEGIDKDTALVRERLGEEEAKQEGHSALVRQAMTAKIIELREELSEHERIHQQLTRATSAVNSSVFSATRDCEGALKEIQELEDLIRENQTEIDILVQENQKRSEDKAASAAHVEELIWKVEALNAAAKAATSSTVDAQKHNDELHQQLLVVAKDHTTRNDLAGELRVEENDKRNMLLKLKALEDRRELLESRYEDFMSAMRSKVVPHGEEHAEDRIVLSSELESPEDIEARAMVLRGQERGSLLEKGNYLDSKVVQAEIDLKTVMDALELVKAAPQEDPLALEPETLLFLEDIKNKLESEADVIQQKELLYWEGEADRYSRELVAARTRGEHLRLSLEDAKHGKMEALGELRSLQREKAELDRAVSTHQLHASKVQNVVRVKQNQVFSNPSIGTFVQHQENEERCKKVMAQLTRCIARFGNSGAARSKQINPYIVFRSLVEKYGLEHEFGGGSQSTQSSSPSRGNSSSLTIVSQKPGSTMTSSVLPSASSASSNPQPSSSPTAGSTFSSMITGGQHTPGSSNGPLPRVKGNPGEFRGRTASRALVKAIAERQSAQLAHTKRTPSSPRTGGFTSTNRSGSRGLRDVSNASHQRSNQPLPKGSPGSGLALHVQPIQSTGYQGRPSSARRY